MAFRVSSGVMICVLAVHIACSVGVVSCLGPNRLSPDSALAAAPPSHTPGLGVHPDPAVVDGGWPLELVEASVPDSKGRPQVHLEDPHARRLPMVDLTGHGTEVGPLDHSFRESVRDPTRADLEESVRSRGLSRSSKKEASTRAATANPVSSSKGFPRSVQGKTLSFDSDGMPLGLAGRGLKPQWDWDSPDAYAHWRDRTPHDLDVWLRHLPRPGAQFPPTRQEWKALPKSEQHALFDACLIRQAAALSKSVLRYRSPRLEEVQNRVRSLLDQRRLTVTASVFWGRGRYVSILWPYLERNLRSNKGVLDKIVLITKNRDSSEGADVARKILNTAKKRYPGVVVEEPFCRKAYGCAFDEILNDTHTVYLKFDDDIVFIKDGSVEHMVLQVLTNPHYTLFSGSVVNNPHGYGIHQFAGAFQPASFHWPKLGGQTHPPVFNHSGGHAVKTYYGKNVYDSAGSKAHEAFIYNVAHGRLDTYTFDLWNLNECRCSRPQDGLDMCSSGGFYRWSINAISWTYNVSSQYGPPVPKFDEPTVGMGWPSQIAPHRAGVVGESLFVHCQYTRQRSSKPDFGLVEEILLPWYTQLAKEYTATEYGKWVGNPALLSLYEEIAFTLGERPRRS